MKKSFFFLFCVFCAQNIVVAQHKATADSLKGILPEVSGKDKVEVLRDLCYHSGFINFEESVQYGEEAVSLALEIDDKDGLGASYKDLGSTYINAGQYETGLDYSQKALTSFRETQNRESEASAMHNIGIVYLRKGDYPTSLEYLLQALEMKNSLGKAKISSTLNAIGEIYRNKNDYEKAIEFYFRALEQAQKRKNKRNVSYALNSIEIVYRKQGNFEKALEYRMKTIALFKEMGDDYGLAISYNLSSILK